MSRTAEESQQQSCSSSSSTQSHPMAPAVKLAFKDTFGETESFSDNVTGANLNAASQVEILKCFTVLTKRINQQYDVIVKISQAKTALYETMVKLCFPNRQIRMVEVYCNPLILGIFLVAQESLREEKKQTYLNILAFAIVAKRNETFTLSNFEHLW
jgi:hypothetical protein